MAETTSGLHRVEHVMGTAVTLHLADPLPEAALDKHAAEVFAWLHQVDRRFSTYRSDSEVNRLDRRELAVDRCSADLRAVLDECANLWRSTDGWFDVYATKRLDPSGYVKGWAVQVASDRLMEVGLANHCINAGGDVRVQGRPASAADWRIGIRHPWQPQQTCWVLAGTDLAIATSGTYERGHHVVNPRNGEPARQLRSVTVVGKDLGLADAYATAAVAMGLPGLDWLARLSGHESAVVTEDGQCYRSEGLPTWAGDGPPVGNQ